MLETNNPCKRDCPRRSPACHANCWDYFEYDLFNIINRELRQQEQQLETNIRETSRHMKKKKRRRPYADNRGGY